MPPKKKGAGIILPPGLPRALDLSEQLIQKDNEAAMAQIKAHAEKLAKVAEGMLKLLVEADLNWGDWGAIIEMMNDKSKAHFPKIKIKDIANYGTSADRTRGEADRQGEEGARS